MRGADQAQVRGIVTARNIAPTSPDSTVTLTLDEGQDVTPRQFQQQQQQFAMPREPHVEVVLCVPDDQQDLLPRRPTLPQCLTPATMPRVGECVYLSRTSVWVVAMVIHTWPTPTHQRIECWLERVHGRGHVRPEGAALQ